MNDAVSESMKVVLLIASFAELSECSPVSGTIHTIKSDGENWKYVKMKSLKDKSRKRNKKSSTDENVGKVA